MSQPFPPSSSEETDFAAEAEFGNYADWKKWREFLAYDDLRAEYYDAEFSGVALEGKSVFEIGFGSGGLLGWARDRGAKVSGAEVNPWSVAAAETAGIPCFAGDFTAMPGAAELQADIIVAFDVLEHMALAGLRAHLATAAKALRPGGLLAMRYPNGQSPLGLPAQYGDATHKSVLSCAVVEQSASDLPLRTIRYGGSYRVKGSWGPKRIGRMARYAAQDFVQAAFGALYGLGAPLSPVVVHFMRRDEAPAAPDI